MSAQKAEGTRHNLLSRAILLTFNNSVTEKSHADSALFGMPARNAPTEMTLGE